MNIKVGIVDDHQLFNKSLGLLLSNFVDFEVVLSANDGIDLQDKISRLLQLPDIMLIDVEMPRMNGQTTAKWIRQAYPSIKLVALSMNANEDVILQMIQAGCCTYLLKDTNPDEFEQALKEVYSHNYYNVQLSEGSLSHLLINNTGGLVIQVSEKEKEFLQLATSEKTYRQIATLMEVSERTVDGYRASLFTKFRVVSRTGMVLEGIRRGLVKI